MIVCARVLGPDVANALIAELERRGLKYEAASALVYCIAAAATFSTARSMEKLVTEPAGRQELIEALDTVAAEADEAARRLQERGWDIIQPTATRGFATQRVKLAVKPRKPRTQDTKGGRRNGKHTGT